MKNLIKRYLKFIWHYGQAYNLLSVPLSGLSLSMSGFTFIAVAFGLRFPWWGYVLFFILVVLFVSLLGMVIVRNGFTAYYQSLNNSQSPELLLILEKIKGLEHELR